MEYNKNGQREGDYDFELINRSKQAEKELILTFKINELLSEREFLIKKVTALEASQGSADISFAEQKDNSSEYESKIKALQEENEKLKNASSANEEKVKLLELQKQKLTDVLSSYKRSLQATQSSISEVDELLSEISVKAPINNDDTSTFVIDYSTPEAPIPEVTIHEAPIPEVTIHEATIPEAAIPAPEVNTYSVPDYFDEREEFYLHPEDMIPERAEETLNSFEDGFEDEIETEMLKEEAESQATTDAVSENEKAYYKRAVNIADILEKYSK